MKTNAFKFTCATLCAAVSILLLFVGCASTGSSSQESLLSAAGFRVHMPKTVKQQEVYAALPPYKLQRASAKDKVFYLYKDEKQGVAYVGGEPEYQRYHELAIQKQIARDNYEAAEMNSEAATGWYGAWGRGYVW